MYTLASGCFCVCHMQACTYIDIGYVCMSCVEWRLNIVCLCVTSHAVLVCCFIVCTCVVVLCASVSNSLCVCVCVHTRVCACAHVCCPHPPLLTSSSHSSGAGVHNSLGVSPLHHDGATANSECAHAHTHTHTHTVLRVLSLVHAPFI